MFVSSRVAVVTTRVVKLYTATTCSEVHQDGQTGSRPDKCSQKSSHLLTAKEQSPIEGNRCKSACVCVCLSQTDRRTDSRK